MAGLSGYGGQASLGRACADLFQQARLNTDCKINFPGWVGVGVVGKAENIATQPSLAGAWAELGKIVLLIGNRENKTWSSVSNSSLVRHWFQSKKIC